LCMVDSSSKNEYNFDIYFGKIVEAEVRVMVPHKEASLVHAIFLKLKKGLKEKGYCIVMDNYFL
jgi:hypothetical protein